MMCVCSHMCVWGQVQLIFCKHIFLLNCWMNWAHISGFILHGLQICKTRNLSVYTYRFGSQFFKNISFFLLEKLQDRFFDKFNPKWQISIRNQIYIKKPLTNSGKAASYRKKFQKWWNTINFLSSCTSVLYDSIKI